MKTIKRLIILLALVILLSFVAIATPRFLGPPIKINDSTIFSCFKQCINEKNKDFSECSKNYRAERTVCNENYNNCIADARNTSSTRKEFNEKKKICREENVECKKAAEDNKKECFNNGAVDFLACMQECRDNRNNNTCPSIQPPADDFCLEEGKIVSNGIDSRGCQIPPSCLPPNCGDGICQNVVCQGPGCPIQETTENCPADCKNNECKKDSDCPLPNIECIGARSICAHSQCKQICAPPKR